jgi:cell division protein FtsN
MKSQRGGFLMGLIVGLIVGLALALGVALYVTKVPIPFVNKVPQRTAEQDAAEVERNRNWDPNSPLYGRNPARPGMAPAPRAAAGTLGGPAAPSPVLPPPDGATAATAVAVPDAAPRTSPQAPARRDPADILADRAPAGAPPSTATAAIGSARSAPDPFTYFVQAGAFSRAEAAEQQRARVAMLGYPARVTESDQVGRTVYQVRVGPFARKEEANTTRDELDSSGVESTVVHVQRR